MKATEKRIPADTTLDITTFLNDKKVDGELYAFLQSLSQHDKKDTFVLKKDLPKQQAICDAIGIKSPKTLRTHLNYLLEQKFIEDNGDRYTLPLQENIYFLIPLDTLQFLVDNCREHVIKIYVYLGQRWKWAKSRGEAYKFTYKEIVEHIGLDCGRPDLANRKVKNALELLTMAELINYEDIYIDKVPYKQLKDFSFNYKSIKK